MKTVNYLRGISKVQVRENVKSVINRVSGENILLWDAKEEEDAVSFYIHTKNVRKILNIYPDAEISGRGVPEKLKKLRCRAAFILTALVFACLWFISGFLIWDFSVCGNEEVDEFEIIRVLNENGVNYGSVGFLVDSEKLSNVVLYEIPELSWFAINVRGSRAEISVRERIPVPEIIDPNEQTSVYAEKSGLVTKIEVYDGTRLVGVGDMVEAGDILVSGITESFMGMRKEHALARVYGQTAYEYTAQMPKKYGAKSYTGQMRKIYGVEICGRRFTLNFKSGFDFSEKREEIKPLYVFGARLPVKLVITEFYEYETFSAELSTEECVSVLKDELSAKLRKDNTGDLLWYNFSVEDMGETVSVTLKAHCYERIA